jgi:hypothetical protein
MTDEAIAALLQVGDETAWRRICDDLGAPLYRYCYWLAGADAAAAEDLRQETFLAAIAGIADYRGEVPLFAWLSGIARHKASDARRRRRRHMALDEIDDAPAADPSPPSGMRTWWIRYGACLRTTALPCSPATWRRKVWSAWPPGWAGPTRPPSRFSRGRARHFSNASERDACMWDELPHTDEEIALSELLRQAMAGPDHPLTAAQTVQILASLPARPVPQGRLLWALLPAAACLTLAIAAALSGAVPAQVRGLAIAVTVGNLALSPVAALALVWRRRFQNAI